MKLKILSLGEIVGKPGIYTIKQKLKEIKEQHGIHMVVANGEGTTGGFGIGKNHAIYLKKLGIDLITGGEKLYFKKDMVSHIKTCRWMTRPANLPFQSPGRGWQIIEKQGMQLGVISLLGQSYFRTHCNNPFTYLPELVKKVSTITPYVMVDFHAATTAEKQTMFHLAHGTVSAVVGTHAKALTSDATIMPKGTGVITDNGRCGSMQSVGGFTGDLEVQQLRLGIPTKSEATWQGLELQGVIITLEHLDNQPIAQTTNIEAIRVSVDYTPEEASKENP